MLTALFLTAGCSSPPVSDLRGDWGGEHVTLTVTDGGSSLTFDCAGGTITDPFVLTPSGTFDLAGTFTGGQGGPEPIDPPPAVAARYTGSVSSRTMQLRGVLTDGTVVGPFVLEQGREPLLYRCLYSTSPFSSYTSPQLSSANVRARQPSFEWECSFPDDTCYSSNNHLIIYP